MLELLQLLRVVPPPLLLSAPLQLLLWRLPRPPCSPGPRVVAPRPGRHRGAGRLRQHREAGEDVTSSASRTRIPAAPPPAASSRPSGRGRCPGYGRLPPITLTGRRGPTFVLGVSGPAVRPTGAGGRSVPSGGGRELRPLWREPKPFLPVAGPPLAISTPEVQETCARHIRIPLVARHTGIAPYMLVVLLLFWKKARLSIEILQFSRACDPCDVYSVVYCIQIRFGCWQ